MSRTEMNYIVPFFKRTKKNITHKLINQSSLSFLFAMKLPCKSLAITLLVTNCVAIQFSYQKMRRRFSNQYPRQKKLPEVMGSNLAWMVTSAGTSASRSKLKKCFGRPKQMPRGICRAKFELIMTNSLLQQVY